MIVALFSCFFLRSSLLVSILLLIPLVIDGVLQLLSSYESNNTRRFITGALFGYGLAMLVIITTIMAFQHGLQIGREIRYG